MTRRRRIAKSFHVDSQNRVSLVMTHHDEGKGDVYRVEANGVQVAWVGTEDEAKARAAEMLNEKHHQCSEQCSDWVPIPQPEPLTEGEKKNIVACFRQLAEAVQAGKPHANELAALQHEYRGELRPMVDGFDAMNEKAGALQQLEGALRHEIESFYW